MAISMPTLLQRVQLETSGVSKGVTAISRGEGLVTRSFSRMGRAVTLFGGVVGGLAVGKVFKDSLDEIREAGRISRITSQVIKTTGGAAHVTAGQVSTLSTNLSNLAGIDDEVIQGGANVILTFRNIRNETGKGNDIFNQATAAALDMSVALGKDLTGSSIQVGKALNDPIKGITALGRAGVQFTADQKEQIKSLVASGDVLSAQKIILRELQSEFGGAASAAADPLQRLGVVIKNLEESFGGVLLPIIDKGATFLTNTFIPAVLTAGSALSAGFGGRKLFAEANGIIGIFQRVGEAVRGVIEFIKGDTFGAGANLAAAFGIEGPGIAKLMKTLQNVRDAIANVVEFIQRNWKPILIAAGAVLLAITSPITAVVAALVLLYTRFQVVRDVVQSVAQFIGKQIDEMVKWVRANLDDFREAFRHIVTAVLAFWHQFGDEITAVVKAAWGAVRGQIEGVIKVVTGIIQTFIAVINGDWGKAWKGLAKVASGVWQIIRSGVRLLFTQLKAILTAGLGVLRRVWEIAWNAITAAAASAWPKITAAVGSGIDTVVGFITTLPSRILSGLGDLASLLVRVGEDILRGLATGIANAAPTVVQFFVDLPGNLLGLLAGAGKWLIETGLAVLRGLLTGFVRGEVALIKFVIGLAPRLLAALVRADVWLLDTGKKIIAGMVRGVVIGAVTLFRFFVELPGNIVKLLPKIAGVLVEKGSKLISGMLRGIVDKAQDLYHYIASIPGKIVGFLPNAVKWLFEIGKHAIHGLFEGFRNQFSGEKSWLQQLPGLIAKSIPGGSLLGGFLDALPGGASGGTIPGPFGKPFPMVAHGGEILVGLDEVRKLRRQTMRLAPPPAEVTTGPTDARVDQSVTVNIEHAEVVDWASIERARRMGNLLQRKAAS